MKTLIIATLALSGCATITNCTRQNITFEPPAHQVCAVSRVDGILGSVQASSPTITIERNRYPITLDCGDSVTVYTPEINAAGYTSIGLIDFGLIDSITGAMWEYKP